MTAWGIELSTFTKIHVALSLIGIVSGLVVVAGLITDRSLRRWTVAFLATTIATSVTGFGFPVTHFGPAHYVGIISLIALLAALLGRYAFHLSGGWRRVYVINAVIALYLNVFVFVVQAFQKVQSLHALAPTQKEPPFAIAQGVVLIVFVALGIVATRRFMPVRAQTA